FASNHCQFGHGRFTVGKEQLGTVKNNATVLLVDSGQKPWYVHERDERDVECVTEADETRCFTASINIEHARKDGGLVCHYTDRIAIDACESGQNFGRESRGELIEIATVRYARH